MTDEQVDSFLAHHGILGQKWGVRRYQNEDGSLTEVGKKRYQKDLDRATSYQSKIDKNTSKIDDKTNSPKSKIRRGKLESQKLYFESKKNQFEPRASKAIARRLSGRKSLFRIENLPTEKFLDNRAIYKFGKYNSRVAEIDRVLRRMDKSVVDLEVKNVKLDGKIQKLFDRYKDVPASNFRSDFEERKKTLGHSEYFDDFLEHHGILGQKWGVRRYQNVDGSLTEAGKKRLEDYRQSEVNRYEKRGKSPEKARMSYDKAVEKYNLALDKGLDDRRLTRLADKSQRKLEKALFAEKMKRANLDRLSELTYDDMLKENAAVRKDIALSVALTAASIPASSFTGFYYLWFPDTEASRLNTRFSVADVSAVRGDARREASDYRNKHFKHSAEDYDSFLAHHGVLGQKWGVRRFQNKDGSLTVAGKKRRDKLLKQLEEVGGTEKREAEKFDEAGKSTRKTVDEIRAETEYLRADNDYRRAVNDQLNLQKQYSDLTRPAPGPRKKTASEKVQEVLDPLTKIYNFPPIKSIGDGVSKSAVTKINELMGIKEPKSYDKLLKSVSDQRKYEIEKALLARFEADDTLSSYADQYYKNELDKVTPGKGGGKGNKGLSDDDLDKLIKRLRDEGVI